MVDGSPSSVQRVEVPGGGRPVLGEAPIPHVPGERGLGAGSVGLGVPGFQVGPAVVQRTEVVGGGQGQVEQVPVEQAPEPQRQAEQQQVEQQQGQQQQGQQQQQQQGQQQQQQGVEPDELVKKLYDPLLRRLKAELWLDRERRGLLTDRWH
ncbi:MAG: hypothetical protein HOY78_16455 [Saccharothrix sp.]|nr:hypothetical protein [Saccharothrix sp.]